MTKIIKIDPLHPDDALIDEAVAIIREGGVIAYPTETLYGLGADCFREDAIGKIFDIKGRAFNSPIALIGGSRKDLELITDDIPEVTERLMKAFWPGPLTLIFKASPKVPPGLTAGTGKIGIRISSHPVALALAGTLGRPVTATSANLSGGQDCVNTEEVLDQLGRHIDMILDGGRTPGGKGSTMVDLTVTPPVILRKGVISDADILALL